MLRIIPLGGLGEIGLNCMLFELGEERVLVDAGMLFPSSDMHGVDVLIPDFAYLQDRPLSAVLLTHGHEDHVGALGWLLREQNVPVYGTPFTLGMARGRLEEMGLVPDLRPIGPREPFQATEHLRVEALRMVHSMPDATAFAIASPEGTVVHTGDFKLDDEPVDGHHTDLERLRELGDQGVLCLLSDSTGAEHDEPPNTEARVRRALARVFSEAPGRVVGSFFASNLYRLQAFLDLSAEHGRRVVLHGRSMLRNLEVGAQTGHLRVDRALLISLEEALRRSPREVTVLTTGSQAEPRAGLYTMATEARELTLGPSDTVVLSARPIPGNERAVSDLMNLMLQRGARVVHPGQDAALHASGHASRPQQRAVLDAVRPRHFVPIHGEERHLRAHLQTGQAAGVRAEGLLLAHDGDVLGFENGAGAFLGYAPAGRVIRDRFGGGDVTEEALRERARMAETGVVFAALAVDASRGRLVGKPTLEGRGLSRLEQLVLPRAAEDAATALAAISPELLGDEGMVREELARAVRGALKQYTAKRAAVVPLLIKV